MSHDDSHATSGTRVPTVPIFHRVLGDRLDRTFPGSQTIHVAMGCFWGAEKLFWQLDGVMLTAVGYMGGHTDAPTYRQVCSGLTGHAETVRLTYDPHRISTREVLTTFVENHDPTQGMRQGNDVGTQYRSALWCTTRDQFDTATEILRSYGTALARAGYPPVTTTVEMADGHEFHLAEPEHQQYLAANPGGYCPVHATGVRCSGPQEG